MKQNKKTQREQDLNLKSLSRKKLKEEVIWEKYMFRTTFGIALLFLLPFVLEGFFGSMFMLLMGFLTVKSALNMAGLFRIEKEIKEKEIKEKEIKEKEIKEKVNKKITTN